MIIADLAHLDVVVEESDTINGSKGWKPYAFADSTAFAEAIGFQTKAWTATETAAVAGLFSRSASASRAEASGFPG